MEGKMTPERRPLITLNKKGQINLFFEKSANSVPECNEPPHPGVGDYGREQGDGGDAKGGHAQHSLGANHFAQAAAGNLEEKKYFFFEILWIIKDSLARRCIRSRMTL